MPIPYVVPAYAGLFALFYFFLTMRVAFARRRAGVVLGTGGDAGLERVIRAHGNFIEYIPLALILLGFMEAHRHSIYALHALCILLLIGRVCHAIGMSRAVSPNPLRFAGMVLTGTVLIVAGIILIADYFRIAAVS